MQLPWFRFGLVRRAVGALLVSGLLCSLFSSNIASADTGLAYPVIAVRAPYRGTQIQTTWQEVMFPASIEPHQSLVMIYPSGAVEVLVDCETSNCSIVDPHMDFSGNNVYYVKYHDMSSGGINPQRGAPYLGADIYRMNLQTRDITQLTNGASDWSPNTGVVNWAPDPLGQTGPGYRLGYGIMNLGPCPIPGPNGEEWVVFTSNRNSFVNARGFTGPNAMQLFIMDGQGRNVRNIGYLNLGSALHPEVLKDGTIMFSTSEAQGIRDSRLWGLWKIWPDGTKFAPLMSAFGFATALHFQTELSDGTIAVTEYYNLNNNGFGTILGFNPQTNPTVAGFGSPIPSSPTNPLVRIGRWALGIGHPNHLQARYAKYSFSPNGLRNLTAFSDSQDQASPPDASGNFAGKGTHPSGAPDGMLFVYSTGPVNDLNRPTTMPRVHGEIALLRNNTPVDDPSALLRVAVDPNYNYQQPRAVVSYRDIYGVDRPAYLPYLPNGRTPYAIIGTSSFYNRNTRSGIGNPNYSNMDSFNTSYNDESTNWNTQGADAGIYTNSDIWAVRILAQEPSSHLSYSPDGWEHTRSGFRNVAGERLRILGEIPVRKPDLNGQEPLDGDGNPDTSFKARIPADVSFTFQTLDRDGMVLNMSQTWHQARPGEQHFDCGGCHAHANKPTDIATTAAGRSDYQVWDLVDKLTMLIRDQNGNPAAATYTGAERKTRMDVEYQRDIKPIIERSCMGCHSGPSAAAKLDLSTTAINSNMDQAYKCLAADASATCGHKPVIPAKIWRQTNLSRYVRAFQSRRSLLIWKLYGRRLDGWQNSDHPTETVPGDASTLNGASPNEADIDYTGTIMPPPGSGYQPLTDEEKKLFVRWVDLGAPTNNPDGSRPQANWSVDETRPTLNISIPRPETVQILDQIEYVAHDFYSGLNPASARVTADFAVNGKPAGTNLASDFVSVGEGRWALTIQQPITHLAQGTIRAEIKDNAGNVTKQETLFHVDPSGQNPNPPPPNPPFHPLDPGSPPSGPGQPPTNPGTNPGQPPVFPSAVQINVSEDPFSITVKAKRKRVRGQRTMIVHLQNLSLPQRTSVTFTVNGKNKIISFSPSKKKFKIRAGARVKLKFKLKGAGSFPVTLRAKWKGGGTSRSVIVNGNPPG